MEFETHKAFENWLEGQSREICVAIATRAALRVWPVVLSPDFWTVPDKSAAERKRLALLTAWSMMTSGVAALAPSPEVKNAAAAANAASRAAASPRAAYASASAANAASRAASVASRAAASAAAANAASRAASVASRASASAASAASAADAAEAAARAAARAAAYADAGPTPEQMMTRDLWHGKGWPEGLASEDLGETLLDTDPEFDFFARWYRGMLAGTPLDWELQRRVALIDPEIWKAGPPAVASEIARIEAEWKAERAGAEPRAPEFEPDSVAQLFQYPRSVSASARSVSGTIRQSLDIFINETGLNQTPEFLVPLERVPASLDRIAEILTHQEQNSASEQALREEIGRLNAKVAALEVELEKARTDLELQSRPCFGKTLRLATGFTALCTAVWVVSGDELGPKKRMETIVEYGDFVRGLFPGNEPAPVVDHRPPAIET